MPIRPENKARYPKNWPEIRDQIRARSGNRCECTGQCGRIHNRRQELGGLTLTVDRPRCQAKQRDIIDDSLAVEEWRHVVLTVMHLDHQPENCADANLLHACQGCHNRYDAPHRRAGIKARARAARASGDLFQCKETI